MATSPLEQQMRAAGLEVLGPCENLSSWPGLMEESVLLQDFSAGEVDVLGSLMLQVRARPGQMLIAEGDANDWMMLLLRGTVDVGKRIGPEAEREIRGDNTRLAVLRPGTVLGEMSMFDGEPRYASCWALSDVEAAVLDRSGVERLIRARPDIGAKLLVKLTQLLAQRLRNVSSQLVRVLQQHVG
ncbi:MAG TPA: cyclic nucleotide-binding domain-containing protein [Ramlibacter sp.]|uniref:cyclic nucleotide-binding domain-containing protein n=1 Tax=Ramlibacter sp. TaxID=1917967 RepID=UPI002D7F0EEA|nr:cyclic nucleotide-binding domain-containing protein [Ramlibacter sp.]HET8747010.1 cyclic nucleotide-binding domain-containing protein [Ramlibacter sp.]